MTKQRLRGERIGLTRIEALKIGRVIADRWYRHNKPLIQSKQHIERMKAQKK